MNKYKIDDVAKESGLTKRTIRYYEELGLLEAPERTEGGMRLYTREHIEHLKQIVNARDVLGFSLQEIQDFVRIREELEGRKQVYGQTVEDAQQLQQLLEIQTSLDAQIRMIEQKMEKMTEFRQELDRIYTRVTDGIKKFTP
ncbi:MerR family transcriptional regulator [Paenibacillus koleovorans]|uniref:MerR family transcriptional regulator n=1 Tax=Paenibacillus koleovorans TaxID=121608 RepID=UPI000FDB6E9B|nr:MerR family transcriptional regulator [Paenibacillus koleovorans]